MAEQSFVTVLPKQSKPVQQIDISNGDIPLQYIRSDQDDDAISSSVTSVDIPVIDISLLSSSSPAGVDEIKKLRTALRSWGCFQAINHSIPAEFMDSLQNVVKGFFRLSVSEKKRYSVPFIGEDGYGNDTVFSDKQILDWCDRIYLIIYPEDQRRIGVWPENPPEFRKVIHDYGVHLKVILETILKAMAKSLDLQQNSFLDQYGERRLLKARFNFYPRCPRPHSVLGLKPHADGSGVTILLPDKDVQGLQFLKENQWYKPSIIPDALLINIGDQTEIMTNGLFKSPVHRVVTNPEHDRISIAVFCSPGAENVVHPAEELIRREAKARYKCIKGYLKTYFQNYQEGQRPIDAVRL